MSDGFVETFHNTKDCLDEANFGMSHCSYPDCSKMVCVTTVVAEEGEGPIVVEVIEQIWGLGVLHQACGNLQKLMTGVVFLEE